MKKRLAYKVLTVVLLLVIVLQQPFLFAYSAEDGLIDYNAEGKTQNNRNELDELPGDDLTVTNPGEDNEGDSGTAGNTEGRLPEDGGFAGNGLPQEDTVDIQGRVVFMGCDGVMQDQVHLVLYVNGIASSDFHPVLEPEMTQFPAWRYSFAGLPAMDEVGEPYTYSVRGEGYAGDSGTKLYYLVNGAIVEPSEITGQSRVDLVYVRIGDVLGEYRVEREEENPPPEGIMLMADTLEPADRAFLPEIGNIFLTSGNTHWRLPNCPQYNPITGNRIDYRVWVEGNADGYRVEYLNLPPNEYVHDAAFAEGVIVNRYAGVPDEEYPRGEGFEEPPVIPASPMMAGTAREENNTILFDGTVSFVVRVNWNDNNSVSARPAELGLTIYYQLPGMVNPEELTDALLVEWGFIPSSISPDVDSTSQFNYWTYTYTLPEKLITKDGQTDEPISEASLTYSFDIKDETALQGSYFIDYNPDGNSVMLTKETTFSINKVWKDSNNQYGTRPDQSAMLANMTLFRSYTAQNMQTVTDKIVPLSTLADPARVEVSGAFGDGTWEIKVLGLPQYDADGILYTYSITETGNSLNIASGSSLTDAESVKYIATYKNVGNYTDRADTCYENGQIVNTLTDTAQLSFEKEWQDDGKQNQNRPDGKLYLYRYPNISGRDYTKASPVTGIELELDTLNDTYEIDFSEQPGYPNGGFPRFDEEGNEYVYFVQEILSGSNTGGYTKFYYKDGSSSTRSQNALYSGETLQNRRTGTVDIPVTKTWKAAARQDMNASVTLLVERRLKDSPSDTDYTPATDVSKDGTFELLGFRAEAMELTHVFAGLPQFNEEGLEYEYRVTEKAVKIDGVVFNLSSATDKGGVKTCVIGGYTYEMSQSVGANGAITLTNKLVGETEVRVQKVWSGIDDASSATGVTVDIYRNGEPEPCETITIASEDVAIENSGILNKAGEWITESFPRYDDEGREYRYTVTERPVTGFQTTYSTKRTPEEKDGVYIGVVETTITNTPEGEGKHVVVSKQWYDDGEENCRGPVNVELYRRVGVNGWKPVSTGTLSAENDWTIWMALENAADKYTDYYVREIDVTRNNKTYKVEYEDYPTLTIDSNSPTPLGELETDAHFYDCYAFTNDDQSSYTFRNVRKGLVNIHLEKEWKDDDYHLGKIDEVTIEIRRRLNYSTQEEECETVALKDANLQASFFNLPKYDRNGVLYHYTVAETKVNGSTLDVPDGFTLDGHKYTASVSEDRNYGEHNKEGDLRADDLSFLVTNARVDTVHFSVYKIWKDITRTGETKTRPDIYLTLYQTVGTVTTPVSPYVERVWTTTGSYNEYYWRCVFDPLPRYTANGEEITYTVLENMPFAGEYVTSYYDASPIPTSSAAAIAVASPTNIYDVPSDATPSGDKGVKNGGTIVNLRAADRFMTGQKVWLNVPDCVTGEDLPRVRLQLRIEEYNETIHAFEYHDVPNCPEVELSNNKQDFTFIISGEQKLAKYDKNGIIIKYRAVEVGGAAPGYMEPIYDAYNLTVTNTYDKNSSEIVKVKVTKQWENVPIDLDESLYPIVSIVLYRCLVDDAGKNRSGTEEQVATTKISYSLAETSKNIEFTNLQKYAYNGRPYRYYVREALNGYDVTISDDKNTTDLLAQTDGQYDKQEFEYEITNDYTGIGSQHISLSGTKTWTDFSNKYNTRPTSLNLRIWRAVQGITNSAVDITDYVDVSWTENTWNYLVKAAEDDSIHYAGVYSDFSDNTLYRYAPNGNPYVYYVEEKKPSYHYSGDVGDDGANVTQIGLADVVPITHTAEDGNVIVMGAADGNGNITASFVNTLITTECETQKAWLKNVDNGTAPITQSEFAMMLPDRVTFLVQYNDKGTWKPFPNNTSPVTKELSKEDCIAALKASSSNQMTVSIDGLPKYGEDESDEIEYRIVEIKINDTDVSSSPYYACGYTISDNATILITNTLETIPLTIKKFWFDNDNQDGVRPTSIRFKIVRDGDDTSAIYATLTNDTWDTGVTVYVPKYKANGTTESTYTVEELLTPEQKTDYQLSDVASGVYKLTTPTTSDTDGQTFEFTNTHAQREISIAVKKTWNDLIDTTIGSDNRGDIEPTSVTVTLQRYDDEFEKWENMSLTDGAETVELSDDNGWQHTWSGLQSRYNSFIDNDTMVRYQYRVVETDVTGYTAKYATTGVYDKNPSVVDDRTGTTHTITVRNDLDTVDLPVKKIWNTSSSEFAAKKPVELSLLYRKTGEEDWKNGAATLTLSNPSWAATFTGLPKMDALGTEYEYTVRETKIGNKEIVSEPVYSYTTGVSGGTVTNTLIKRTDISVTKIWDDANNQDGVRPTGVGVRLVKDKGIAGEEQTSATVTLSNTNDWTHTWTNLPKYRQNAEACVYTVVEDVPACYTSTYSLDEGSFTSDYVSITEALGNPDTDVREVTIKNSYVPKTMKLTAKKVWNDDSDRFGMRSESIRFQLLWSTNTDGVTGAEPYGDSVPVFPANSWKYTWEDLPVRKGGLDIYYSVAEVVDDSTGAIAGYQKPSYDYAVGSGSSGKISVSGSIETALAGNINDLNATVHTVEITNALDTVSLTVEKIWEDAGGIYNSRPKTLSFTLQWRLPGDLAFQNAADKNGSITKELSSAQTSQSVVFDGLPKYNANGIKYEYRAIETGFVPTDNTPVTAVTTDSPDPTSGYFYIGGFRYDFQSSTQSVTGGFKTTITNTLEEERISLSGTKTWIDGQNRYQSRPSVLTLTLYYKKPADTGWTLYPGNYSVLWNMGGANSTSWDFSIADLQKYVPGTTTKWEYSVVETTPAHYRQTYPSGANVIGTVNPSTGEITGVNLTNTLVTEASLSVTKMKDRGPEHIMFDFSVHISDSVIGGNNAGVLYTGSYDVYAHNDAAMTTPLHTDTASNGKISVAAKYKFVLKDLPIGFYYKVTEAPHTEYYLDESKSSGLTGQLAQTAPYTLVEAHVENVAITELAIENTTENKDTGSAAKMTNAGGRVIVVTTSDFPDQYDKDDYKQDQLAVAWMPDVFWRLGDFFTIYYVEFGETQERSLTVSDYLDADGNLKPFDQCTFDNQAIADRFINAGAALSFTRDDAVMLILASNINDMPRSTRVAVQFVPTLAVSNATNQYSGVGGTVMVEGGTEDAIADGAPNLGGSVNEPYRALEVSGKADTGYRVADNKIVIRNMDDLSGTSVALSIQPDGSFSVTLPTSIAGMDATVQVTGRVEYTKDNGGNIIDIKIIFDSLPVPLQVDMEFEQIPDPRQENDDDRRFGWHEWHNFVESRLPDPSPPSSTGSTGLTGSTESTGSTENGALSDAVNAGDNASETRFTGLPQTGDNTPIGAVAILGIITAIGAVLLRKKKRGQAENQ